MSNLDKFKDKYHTLAYEISNKDTHLLLKVYDTSVLKNIDKLVLPIISIYDNNLGLDIKYDESQSSGLLNEIIYIINSSVKNFDNLQAKSMLNVNKKYGYVTGVNNAKHKRINN